MILPRIVYSLDESSSVTVQCYVHSVRPEPVEGHTSFDRLRTNGDISGNTEQLPSSV
jgi:hypothetical protein